MYGRKPVVWCEDMGRKPVVCYEDTVGSYWFVRGIRNLVSVLVFKV
jgi:hypothetical protein